MSGWWACLLVGWLLLADTRAAVRRRRQLSGTCTCPGIPAYQPGLGYNYFRPCGPPFYSCGIGTVCNTAIQCCCPASFLTAGTAGNSIFYPNPAGNTPAPGNNQFYQTTTQRPGAVGQQQQQVGTTRQSAPTICPNSNTPSSGRCYDIVHCASLNMACVNGYCCPRTDAWQSVCGGDEAISQCFQNRCGHGYACVNGFCCECPAGKAQMYCQPNGQCPAGYYCQTSIQKCCPVGGNVGIGGGGGIGPSFPLTTQAPPFIPTVSPPQVTAAPGNAVCPNNGVAAGPCLATLCPLGSTCVQNVNLCCRYVMQSQMKKGNNSMPVDIKRKKEPRDNYFIDLL